MRFSSVALIFVTLLARETIAGEFKDLGVQITSSTIQATAFTKDPAGREIVCTVMRGEPAKLIVLDVDTGKLLHRIALEGADGAWNACTASDGSVYIGTDSNGHLYRFIPGENSVHDLGQVLPGQSWVWDVCAGEDGEVFCGTYPGCRVVRYHPKDGFSDVGRGPVAPGENYVRAVAYDRATGKIYAGVGSHAHLIELDPKTGEKSELLPKEYAENEFVYGVEVIGGRVFAYVTRLGRSIVVNPKTRQVESILPAMSGQQAMISSPDDGRVFYTVGNQLMCFDPSKPDDRPASLLKTTDALAFTWISGEIVMFNRYGGLTRFDPGTGKSASQSFKLPSEPTKIQSIEVGPHARIWTGGYLSGGNAAFDLKTGKSTQYKGLSQAEDMTVLGDSIYFGIYPGARLSTYDTTKPWDVKKENPRQFGTLTKDNQSRPMAMCGVKELNRVFIGTIPEYGLLGGVLAEYDVATGTLEVHPDVAPRQSIVSLCFSKGMIVAGTSIWGGLGQKPVEKSARLFVWDPNARKNVFEITPIEGAQAITGLFVGPDKNIWGMADGTLIIFDPDSRKIKLQKKLFDVPAAASHVWRDAFFTLHPSGRIFGTSRDKLFELDPAARAVTVLRDSGANLLTMDRDGRLYFADKAHLWQYTP